MTDARFANPQVLIQQILEATNTLSDQEAAQRYQQILTQLPSAQAAELNALALQEVGQEERQHLAGQFRQAHNNTASAFNGYHFDDDNEAASPQALGKMSVQAQQQDPTLLGSVFGGNSALGGTIGKAALGALAAILIRQVMSRQGSYGQGQPTGGMGAGDPIGAILGGLLGGGSGGLGGGSYGGQQMPGGVDLGSILGGVLGGGRGSGLGGGSYGGSQQMPGGIDLGSILGGVLGGAAAPQTPQGGGLGSILGSILGGATGEGSSGSHRR